MYCRFCGKSIPENTIFCSYCGGMPSEVTSQVSKQRKLIDKFVWIPATVIIVVALTLVVAGTIMSSLLTKSASTNSSADSSISSDSDAFNNLSVANVESDLGLGVPSSQHLVTVDGETYHNTWVSKGDNVISYTESSGAMVAIFISPSGNIFQISVFAVDGNNQALNDVGTLSNLIMSILDPSLTQDTRGSIMNTLTSDQNAITSYQGSSDACDNVYYTIVGYKNNSNIMIYEFSAVPE